MPSLIQLSDYLQAIHVASGRRFSRYPVSAHSVLLSRFGYGIGPKLHSLFGLMDQPREKWKDYLLDEDVRLILRRINPPDSREVVNDKLAFHEHCLEHGLATIPVICAVDSKGPLGRNSLLFVTSREDWLRRLRYIRQPLFMKLIDGSWGQQAFAAEPSGPGWSFEGQQGTCEDLYAFALERFEGRRGWLVQPRKISHPDLQRISAPGVLATIRCVTCVVDGMPHLLFACLRIPVGRNVTDNFSHGSMGNVTAPIDTQTGEIGPCRGSINKQWPEIVDIPFHPDTGNRIQGTLVPMWKEVLELLDRGQRSLPRLRTLGWDIAVTREGPLVVETNATYDVDVLQVSHQRGVGNVLTPWLERHDV